MEGKVLILQPEESKAHELNETASYIWEGLGEKGESFDELLKDMAESFDEEEETIRNDLHTLLLDMQEKGLVSLQGAT